MNGSSMGRYVPFIEWKQDLKSISLDTDRGQHRGAVDFCRVCISQPVFVCMGIRKQGCFLTGSWFLNLISFETFLPSVSVAMSSTLVTEDVKASSS